MQCHRANTIVGCLGLAVVLTLSSAHAQTAPRAELGLGAVQVHQVGGAGGGQVVRSQTATFALEKMLYGIRSIVRLDTQHGDRMMPSEGYIGMPAPSDCNWYAGGFLFILLDGKDIGARTRLSSMTVAQRGDRAILDLVWHDSAASVRVRFLALPGYDHLDCEVAIEPKQALHSVAVRLNCYPSFFTAHHHRQGARRVQTSGKLLEQGQRATLPARENWWAVYYDEVFDVARGEGEGPCAVLLEPGVAEQVTFNVGDYAVGTQVSYPASTHRIRLAFWDFHGKTNAEALERLRQGSGELQKELAEMDCRPAILRGVDFAAMRNELRRAMESKAVRDHLGEKRAAIQGWLDKYATLSVPPPDASGVAAEEHLLEAMQDYDDFVWSVKLATLLAQF